MRTMLLVLALAVPTLAAADPTPPSDVTKMHADDCARARKQNKTCVLSIESEDVQGERPAGSETTILVNPFGDHASLITLRTDFIPEILKSAEDL